MDKGYVENGFIVDLTNAKKTSEIIYELSRILDMPESKEKHICLKLGSVDLSEAELTSIKSLVEVMESQLAFISTSSTTTLESATALDIKISEFTEQVEAPSFENQVQEETSEVTVALDNIFGDEATPEPIKAESKEIHPVLQHDEIIAEQMVEQEIEEKLNCK